MMTYPDRRIWVPAMKPVPETQLDAEGRYTGNLRYIQPSSFPVAVSIALSDFGCGQIINTETREIHRVERTSEVEQCP